MVGEGVRPPDAAFGNVAFDRYGPAHPRVSQLGDEPVDQPGDKTVDKPGDKTVAALDYSAHPQAAEVARALADRLAHDGRAVRLAVVHRVGHLEVGDIAVVVGVSAEHRGEAFDVCRELIDEFKATIPIWKHQRFADGADEWVGLP